VWTVRFWVQWMNDWNISIEMSKFWVIYSQRTAHVQKRCDESPRLRIWIIRWQNLPPLFEQRDAATQIHWPRFPPNRFIDQRYKFTSQMDIRAFSLARATSVAGSSSTWLPISHAHVCAPSIFPWFAASHCITARRRLASLLHRLATSQICRFRSRPVTLAHFIAEQAPTVDRNEVQ
jgi:hypothetical protein